ncbi:MAG TPA: hypothetical protein VLN47_10165 [Clostridiaceae bacterium]|nr:hypothetical protein [Clostridiaceae bacterium]
MKKYIRFVLLLLLGALLLTSCAKPDSIYYGPEEALKKGDIIIDGSTNENRARFELFLNNVNSRRSDSIRVIIYDIIEDQYVIDIRFDGEKFTASRTFITKDSEIRETLTDMEFTHLIQTGSRNYFLTDARDVYNDLWIFQAE